MNEYANAMSVFKLLEKSNCRKCNEKTCLAFAAKVYKGERTLGECPKLPDGVAGPSSASPGRRILRLEQDQDHKISRLKEALKTRDFQRLAKIVKGDFKGDRLFIRILGKPFSIDTDGRFSSDIHTTPWLVLTVLEYLLNCQGLPLSGQWVPFRELKHAGPRNALFVREAEVPMKRLADEFSNLFEDLVRIFDASPVEDDQNSDLSFMLMPLPRLPVLIRYWQPDEGMASDLHLFFDATAVENSSLDTVFAIGSGLARMFEKISDTHGWKAFG